MAKNGFAVHPFVCVEGVDGSGKTTTAKILAAALGGIYYKTPPQPFAAIRGPIDKTATPSARFHFYLSAVAFASAEIEQLILCQPVVCDRYVFSTLAYHLAMDERLRAFPRLPALLLPDVSVLLVADETARLARIRARVADNLPDRRFEQDSRFMRRVLREFRTMGLVEINTTHLAPIEVAQAIIGLLPRCPASTQKPEVLV